VTAFGVIPKRKANEATGVITLVTAGLIFALIIKGHRRLTQCNPQTPN
jgi:hypothetical protein